MLAKFGGHFSFSQIFKKRKNMPMTKTKRELTTGERCSIRKLVTGHCANYDSEYGCLPLDCECPMLGIPLPEPTPEELAELEAQRKKRAANRKKYYRRKERQRLQAQSDAGAAASPEEQTA